MERFRMILVYVNLIYFPYHLSVRLSAIKIDTVSVMTLDTVDTLITELQSAAEGPHRK